MTSYEYQALKELEEWQLEMQRSPTMMNKLAKRVQDKMNRYIPEKIHLAITTAIRQMFRAVLFGAEFTTQQTTLESTLEEREAVVQQRINFYRKTAAAEGGITGAGGLLMGLADFPLLLGIKIKLLFEIAAEYGFDVKDYKERLYILYIFQLAFSSHQTRNEVYRHVSNWQTHSAQLPADINDFNWRIFQQEYRDYIDLAKMAQLIPIIGAPVGAVVNYKLIFKLGCTAISCYRMRLLPKRLSSS